MTTTVVTDRLTRGRDFSVGVIMQVTKGVVNTTPAFDVVRRTTGKPKHTIGYTQSDEVQVTNQGQANIQDTEEFTMELEAGVSKQSINWLKQAIHGDAVALTNTATTYAALADGFTFSTAGYAGISAGDGFWITGLTNPLLDGFYIAASKGGSNKVVTTIAPVGTEAASASVTMKSFKTANADLPSYNMLQRRTVDDSAAGDISYLTLYDAVIDTMSVDIAETGIVQGKASFKAEKRIDGNLLVTGQSYNAAATDAVVSAVQNVLGFYVDGLSYTCIQKKMSIEIGNGYVGDDAAACARQYARGQFEVKGSASFRARYSSPLDWEAIYQAGTQKSLGVRINHNATDETFIVMPQCVVTDHNQADGANDVASHEVSFGAEGNAATSSTIMIFTNW